MPFCRLLRPYEFLYLVRSKLLVHGPAMPLKLHVAAPGSTNAERLAATAAREGFVSVCACTEPVGTDIGAVCVERGRPKGPITMLHHTHFERGKKKAPYEKPFFLWKTKKKRPSRFVLRAPHCHIPGIPMKSLFLMYFIFAVLRIGGGGSVASEIPIGVFPWLICDTNFEQEGGSMVCLILLNWVGLK